MKTFITTFLLAACSQLFAQIRDVNELLTKTQDYYKTLDKFYIKVNEKYQSAISTGMAKSDYYCYVDRAKQIELFNSAHEGLVPTGGYFVRSGNEYAIKYSDSSFVQVKSNKKTWAYYQHYSRFPFINIDFLKDEILKTKVSFVVNDSIYQVISSNTVYQFRKADCSLYKIVKSGVDGMTKGQYYKEITFSSTVTDLITINDKIIVAENIIESDKKTISASVSKPKVFDVNYLKSESIQWFNDKPQNLTGKKILIDFFFQGCYPCVKSYPYLNDLYKDKDSNTLIISVDTLPEDSLSAVSYIKRYDIKYPVICGQKARQLSREFGISEWPTIVIIDEEGKIILYHQGFNRNVFKKIRNII